MIEILIIIISSLGTIFAMLAAIGLIRMPDTYLRISVNTKAATLGVGLLLGASAIYFGDVAISSRVLAIIIFIFLTAPIGGHLLGRTGYISGNELFKETKIDDLKGMYNKKTHKLSSGEENKKPNEPNEKQKDHKKIRD
jgi:multicomponent Na+:H+ antiporter subunit G